MVFFRENEAEEIVDVEKLVTNPFPYVKKVILVKAIGRRMIAETEAIFSQEHGMILYYNPFVVSGIPAQNFVANKEIYVVGRVVGLKVPSTSMEGGMPIVYLEYAGEFSGYSWDEIQEALAQARR